MPHMHMMVDFSGFKLTFLTVEGVDTQNAENSGVSIPKHEILLPFNRKDKSIFKVKKKNKIIS